jgi:hypothetical protein
MGALHWISPSKPGTLNSPPASVEVATGALDRAIDSVTFPRLAP